MKTTIEAYVVPLANVCNQKGLSFDVTFTKRGHT